MMDKLMDKRQTVILLSILCIILGIIIGLFLFSDIGRAEMQDKVVIYFFWGDGCPHCAAQKPFLENMEDKYPQLDVKSFETWNNQENQKLFQEMAAAYGIEARGVPTTFIGDYHPIVGYSESMADDIEEKILSCLEDGCIDPIEKMGQNNDEKTDEESKELCLHFFYQEDCNQCQNVDDFLTDLKKEYNIDINRHDVEEEKDLYQDFKENYGLGGGAYPIIFIGDRYFIGNTTIKNHLEREIILCQESGCVCPADDIMGYTPSLPKGDDVTAEKEYKIDVPLIGQVNVSNMSLVAMTFLVAFVDGFNPCSLWVITFLLGIVIHSGSRKKTFAIGLTFITVATLVYGLFILGLFNTFSVIGYMTWIKLAVASVAFIFGIVNIKDYFWYKKGISFTIPDRFKPKIFRNIRGIMKRESILGMILATIIMSFGVTFIELICTAGFPVIWTSILVQRQVTRGVFTSLFGLYMLIYFIDEFIVFAGVVFTLKASKFEETQGRMLKLVGGIIMLALAGVWLVEPELMNNVSGMFYVFGASIGMALLIHFVCTKVLPKYGIKIGAKEDDKDNSKVEKGGGQDDQK